METRRTGTAAAPKLVGISLKFNPDQIASLLHKPTAKMTAGGMPTVNLKEDEMKALIAYLQSLK